MSQTAKQEQIVSKLMALAVEFANQSFHCGVLHGQDQTLEPSYEVRSKEADAARGALEAAIDAISAPAAAIDARWTAAVDVLAERKRQISVEGWTAQHDDEHSTGEMARAAAAYAYPELTAIKSVCVWPWGPDWWKPRDPRSNLVRAGALILAEIERLDRAATSGVA